MKFQIKALLFASLFLPGLLAVAGAEYDEVKKIAARSGCNVHTATMAEVFLGFGKGLNRNGQEPGVLQKFIDTAGRFQIELITQAARDHLYYLTVLKPTENSIMVDVRFLDKSSVQVTFICPSVKRRAQLDRISAIQDISDQFDAFFKILGYLPVQSRSDMLMVFDMEDLEERGGSSPVETGLKKCDGCQKSFSPEKLKVCGKCKSVRYCGQDCQKAAWAGGHNKQCRAPGISPESKK